jgi:hypothetical protein
MFNTKENPVGAVKELAQIMTFVNEAMDKMKPEEQLSPGAVTGLRVLLIKLEENMTLASEELSQWKRVGQGGKSGSESPRRFREKTE